MGPIMKKKAMEVHLLYSSVKANHCSTYGSSEHTNPSSPGRICVSVLKITASLVIENQWKRKAQREFSILGPR